MWVVGIGISLYLYNQSKVSQAQAAATGGIAGATVATAGGLGLLWLLL